MPPLLDLIFKLTKSKVIVHAHKKIDAENFNYIFSGTNEEDKVKNKIVKLHKAGKNSFNVKFHGYYAWFNNFEDAKNFVEGKCLKTKDIEWEQYNNIFPERYLKISKFDSIVKEEIGVLSTRLKRKINILEIGSNKKIRFFNKRYVNNYYAFDKFVQVEGKNITLIKEKDLSKIRIDLVILRNSFNYLNKSEIVKIKKIVSKNKCVLMFNTFKEPTVIKRSYKSKSSRGIEISEYDEENNKINHSLYPQGKNYVIRHSFFYYNSKQIKELFKGLKFEKMKNGNTLQLIFQ